MATMTAAAKRAAEKVRYDAFLAVCPSQRLLDRIADKWVTLVLTALGSGPDCHGEPRAMRYSELARVLAGVSPKMLSQTLRALERDGLLTRTAMATVPVTVSYELTPLGLSLQQTVRHLKLWAEAHMDEVSEHRERYDDVAEDRAAGVTSG
ncbi:helix-turn-helix domain-containing protein [Curtobacterium sp. MCPF17_002]|uniref:winged helix-turn-helix transcriptional regulator n=1 Tax=Curtobacterium sp. MCPF17_002 TaxID=2175645 RepID=UPI000DA97FB9|nr:helix-turn-helix domain-containing protein [Curtobacterium sp. MCPF17_002]WIB78995.1 helix-turn-helix domain-containing protein [Curtobacterium sp. MCPF17_002]